MVDLNIRNKIIIQVPTEHQRHFINVCNELEIVITEDFMSNFYNLVIDVTQKSLISDVVDIQYVAIKVVRNILSDEDLHMVDSDKMSVLFYITYDMVVFFREQLCFNELINASLYVTKITPAILIVEYFQK